MNTQSSVMAASETLLFEGEYAEANDSAVLTKGIEINDSIENYDELYIKAVSNNDDHELVLTKVVKPSVFANNYGKSCCPISEVADTSSYAGLNVGFINSNTVGIGHVHNQTWNAPHLRKIVGIKYQAVQSDDSDSTPTYTDEEVDAAIDEILGNDSIHSPSIPSTPTYTDEEVDAAIDKILSDDIIEKENIEG